MTLPVSATTTQRYFLAMKIIKSKLRNKKGPEFLAVGISPRGQLFMLYLSYVS